MTVLVRSGTSCATNSFETGLDLGRQIRSGFNGSDLKGIVAYSTVNHDQSAFLQGIREAIGATVPVVGCSSQGIVGREHEDRRGGLRGRRDGARCGDAR